MKCGMCGIDTTRVVMINDGEHVCWACATDIQLGETNKKASNVDQKNDYCEKCPNCGKEWHNEGAFFEWNGKTICLGCPEYGQYWRERSRELYEYNKEDCGMEEIQNPEININAEFIYTNDENVNHPNHYNKHTIEPIDVINDWELPFDLGAVVKYISRYRYKGSPVEDLKKAVWYLNDFVQRLERKQNG